GVCLLLEDAQELFDGLGLTAITPPEPHRSLEMLLGKLSSGSRPTASITKWTKSSSGTQSRRSGGKSNGVSRSTDTKRAPMNGSY
ncbi:MAG: hypothetical protein ABGZ37_14240, partial [Akkermansiaceae bacterium]